METERMFDFKMFFRMSYIWNKIDKIILDLEDVIIQLFFKGKCRHIISK